MFRPATLYSCLVQWISAQVRVAHRRYRALASSLGRAAECSPSQPRDPTEMASQADGWAGLAVPCRVSGPSQLASSLSTPPRGTAQAITHAATPASTELPLLAASALPSIQNGVSTMSGCQPFLQPSLRRQSIENRATRVRTLQQPLGSRIAQFRLNGGSMSQEFLLDSAVHT